jgi:hypothetical protein
VVLSYECLVCTSMCVYCVGECMCMSLCLSGSIFFPLPLSETLDSFSIPHSACPQGYLGTENRSYYDTNQDKTNTYESDRLEYNPASCGKATKCPAAISSINDTVFSDMKTGFAVRV